MPTEPTEEQIQKVIDDFKNLPAKEFQQKYHTPALSVAIMEVIKQEVEKQ